MMSMVPIISAALLALAPTTPAVAARDAGLADYVRARAADAAGVGAIATAGYSAALDAAPQDEVLALRAFRHGLSGGDRALAVRAARILDLRGLLPADGRLLLLGEAVSVGDWRLASALVDRIDTDGAFNFASPVLRAWIALGAGGDPIAALDGATKAGAVGAVYIAEHRALLIAAQGGVDEPIAMVRAMAAGAQGQTVRLRTAIAAKLAKSERRKALDLLVGDDPVTTAARELVRRRKTLPGAVDTPALGISELLVRIAADIARERETPLALGFARMATFLAPTNATAWLVTSELLASADRPEAALAALARVSPTDPFIEAAKSGRMQLLMQTGDDAGALALADAATKRRAATATDWSRVGGIRAGLERYAEAAEAYDRALKLAPEGGDQRWTLQLMKGSALEQAGDWPAAKAAFEAAVKLAPDQPAVLNHVGYSKLERREDLDEAEALIKRASALRPDDPAITDSLGWTYFLRGNLRQAVPTLERAAAAQPGDTTINEHLGDAYWAVGRRYEARYAWNAAKIYAEGEDATRLAAKLEQGFTQALAAR